MYLKTSLILSVVLAFAVQCAEAPDAEKAQVGDASEVQTPQGDQRHEIDLEASQIGWIGTKLTGQHNGTINIKSGYITTEGKEIVGGEFVMDMNTITVLDLEGENKQKLETHLRDTDFFEVGKFPESRFVVTKVEPAEGDNIKVTGNLTMRDTSKAVTFTASVEKGEDGLPSKVEADFNIDRQLWGIVYKGKPDDAIRDEVNLTPTIALK